MTASHYNGRHIYRHPPIQFLLEQAIKDRALRGLSRGMSVFGYSDFLTNLFTRSSTIRKYFLFILSFRKLLPTSFVVSSGTCIYLSSTRFIRASVNPICAPNRSKSMRHGWPVLSNTLHSPDNYVRLFQLIDIEVQEW